MESQQLKVIYKLRAVNHAAGNVRSGCVAHNVFLSLRASWAVFDQLVNDIFEKSGLSKKYENGILNIPNKLMSYGLGFNAGMVTSHTIGEYNLC